MNELTISSALADRRKAMNELTVTEAAEVERLTMAIIMAKPGKGPLSPDRLRELIITAWRAMGSNADLPRGYRILGGTAKTPSYIQKSGVRATDDMIVSDVMTGLLSEIIERQNKELAAIIERTGKTGS